jgi:hypothetical protein
MSELAVLVKQVCRSCRWSNGTPRYWIATEAAVRRHDRCPFCGARKPLTKKLTTLRMMDGLGRDS